jgi:hypothetical protein
VRSIAQLQKQQSKERKAHNDCDSPNCSFLHGGKDMKFLN